MKSIVSTSWLKRQKRSENLVVIDCSNFSKRDLKSNKYHTLSGRPQWRNEHIQGARFADFSKEFSSEHKSFRNALPSPKTLVHALHEMGVGNDTQVVLYDQMQSMWAARLWWMLRWIGFDNAAILDGGLTKWKADGGACTSSPSMQENQKPAPKKLTLNLRPTLFVDKAQISTALKDGSTLIIDALSKAQFEGRESDLGLCGHIPGAINIPAENLIDPTTNAFLSDTDLSQLLPKDKSQPTIIYCGSGIAAALVAFTMTRLGFQHVSIYMPGLQEWLQDKNAPINNRANAQTREISTY